MSPTPLRVGLVLAVVTALTPVAPARAVAADAAVGTVCFRSGGAVSCVIPRPGCNLTPPETSGIVNRTSATLWISRGTGCGMPHFSLPPRGSVTVPADQYSYRYLAGE